MKKISYVFLGCIGILGLILTGCVGPTRLEMYHGSSFQQAKVNQTLNPEAGQNLEPVEGFDGKAAQATIEKYRESFVKPPPPPAFVISIGSSK